jgi:hypothetical protein
MWVGLASKKEAQNLPFRRMCQVNDLAPSKLDPGATAPNSLKEGEMPDSSSNKKSAKADSAAAKAKAKALRPWFQKKRFIIPIALVALMGISIASNQGGVQQGFEDGVESTTVSPDSSDTTESQEEAATETIGQKNARESAESYLQFAAFSRQGLIDQLEFEEYSTEDAEYAVDVLDVDWKEQAAKSAEAYLEFTAFSREGLIDQLVFEGFTQEEAEYGVTAVGY